LADVNAWLNDASSNYGWILIGEEGVKQSAKRYSSRESAEEADRPTLTIHYTDQATGISEADLSEPRLFKAFPNPFSEELTIIFNLKKDQRIELGVFNLLGQQVETIVKGIESAGRYRFTWDGTDPSGKLLPQGMYYVILVRGSEQEVLKILKSR
jgi:hypothetical protein